MNIKAIICILGAALLPAVSLSAAAAAGSVSSEKDGVMKREDMAVITLTAVVEAIDVATRQVTLRGEGGKRLDLVASAEVKRLNEVVVGDTVRVDYVVSILGELRAPTADELANPLTVTTGGGRATAESAPAGAAGVQVRAVTTVEILDRLNMTVTVMGPQGNTMTVDVQDPERLKKVRIGDTVVITYTEAVAVSLEKVTPPKSG